MKYLLLILSTVVMAAMCSKNTGTGAEEYPQKWELVKMTGSMVETETSGEDMAWQEYYLIYSDGTFLKSRTENGKTAEAQGTFEIVNDSDGKHFTLAYPSKNTLIGSCSSEPIEHLFVNSENMLISSWQNCDGPGLEYKRVE